MASVIWDVGLDIKNAYIKLFKLAETAKLLDQEELANSIEGEAKCLKDTYLNLAKDHGWI